LARDISPSARELAWSSDITYIATDEGWLQRHPADTASAASGVIEGETECMVRVRIDTPV